MLTSSKFSLPDSGLVPLEDAFDMIGTHRFGEHWTADMAATVRLGQRSRNPEQRALGCWALKALTQCVENGWLPLIYFNGRKRVRYFEAADGSALHALYPRPTDDREGQIELDGGDIFRCLVDASQLRRTLREKFTKADASKTRGRPRRYIEINRVLDEYFMSHPAATSNKQVIKDVSALIAEAEMPGDTVLHERVNDAKDRAIVRMRTAN